MDMLQTVMRPSIDGRAEPADDREHDVLRAHTEHEIALDPDSHGAGPALGEGLGGEDVLDLRSPDAERQCPEGTMGRGVAVAADDRHAWLGEALLGPDHVHDPLVLVSHGVTGHAELRAVRVEGFELPARDRVLHAAARSRGGHVVVGSRDREGRSPYASACQPQPFECLRRGHLVDEVQVDVEQVGLSGAVAGADDVAAPDLFGERLRHGSSVADRDDLDSEEAAVRSLVVDRLTDVTSEERPAER